MSSISVVSRSARTFVPARTSSPLPALFVILFLLLAGVAPARSASVSGTVALQGVAAGNLAQPLTVLLQQTGGGTVTTYSVTPAASDGSFTLTGLPSAAFSLYFKGDKWLQRGVTVDATGGSVTGVSVTLLGGDVNADNRVDSADISAENAAYRSTPGSPDWNAACDITCDGRVDLADYSIASANYSKIGDAPSAPPTGLTAVAASSSEIDLSWTAPAGATGYQVERSPNGSTGWTQIAAPSATAYQNTGLPSATTLFYRVRATGTAGASLPGPTASATTPGFSLTVTPATLTVPQGGYGSATVGVTRVGGFSAPVSLSVLQYGDSWIEPVVTSSGSLTLHVVSAAPGTYAITISGTSGSLSAQTSVSLTVTSATGSVYGGGPATLNFVDFVTLAGSPPAEATTGGVFPNALKFTYPYVPSSGYSEDVRCIRVTDPAQLPATGADLHDAYLLSTAMGATGSGGVAYDSNFTFGQTYYYYAIQRTYQTGSPGVNDQYFHVGTVCVRPMMVGASEDQAVDSRLDPRWSDIHRIDHDFGGTTYRGGLFAGNAQDPAKVGRSFVKFLPTAATAGLWPVGKLFLYYTRSAGTGQTTVQATRVGSVWTASGLTWDTAPAYTPPSTLPSGSTTLSVTYDAATPANTPPGWVGLSMSGDIAMAVGGGAPLTFGLACTNEMGSDWAYFAKAEYHTGLGPCILYALTGPN